MGMGWLGLASALALWLALIHFETPPFEQGLAARADAIVRERLGDAASVEAEGRDLRLSGLIFDESERQGARDAVAALPGVRLVADSLAPPPLAPFSWRVSWDGSVVTLSGAVPSPAARATLLAAAKTDFPAARIVDEMAYASGAPAGFAAAAAKVLPALAQLQSGEAQWRGEALALAGKAATSADYRAVIAFAAASGGAIKAELVPPPTQNFTFAAENDGNAVALSGFVGSESDRADLLAQARRLFPGARIVDGLQPASGAPPRFAAESDFALRALARLKGGKVALADHVARLSGVARPGTDAAGVAAALAHGRSAVLDVEGVAPGDISPYVLGVEKSEHALILTGFCGDEAACAKIRAAAREKFAGLELTDSMRTGPGAPKDFLAAATGGLDQLARLRLGRLRLRDAAVELHGDAGRAADAAAVKTALIAAMPSGFAVQADVTGAERDEPTPALAPAPPAAPPETSEPCKRLDELARAAVIPFDPASAELSPESAARLDALAAQAHKCPGAALEITGHSDDNGSIAHNFEWSWRRAEAVAAYLLAAGVAPERMKVEGFGETMPLAPNDSDANRAKNRRIEIRVK